MKSFFADWRNSALALAVLVIIIMSAMLSSGEKRIHETKVVRIGSATVITEGEMVKELKKRFGNQLLTKKFSEALLTNYAAKQGIKLTDADVNQFLNVLKFNLDIENLPLDDYLKSQGTTIDEQMDQYRLLALQVKLIVPEEDINKEYNRLSANKQIMKMALPQRFKLRIMGFASKGDAEKALELLKLDGGLEQAAALAGNRDAQKVFVYVPAASKKQDTALLQLLAQLNPGAWSAPAPIPGGKGTVRIVQLVEVIPEELPTIENRGMIIGKTLMDSNKKYQSRAVDLESEALSQVDYFFYPRAQEDYAEVVKQIQDEKLKNPQLPGLVPDAPTTPAAGK